MFGLRVFDKLEQDEELMHKVLVVEFALEGLEQCQQRARVTISSRRACLSRSLTRLGGTLSVTLWRTGYRSDSGMRATPSRFS